MQDLTAKLLDMADIHYDSRSYVLNIEDFNRLCTAYQKLCSEHPGLYEYDFRYNKVHLSLSDNDADDYNIESAIST